MLACNKPTKAGSVSIRLVFETRGKCQDFVVRCKDDGIPYAINSPFCCANTTITVRQSRSIEEREIGKQFMPLWKELADQLKVLFPDSDDKRCIHHPRGRLSITNPQRQRSQKRHWTTSFQTWSNLIVDKHLCLLHLISVFLVFRMRCYNRLSSQPATCETAAPSPHRFFAAWRVEAPLSAVS